MNKRIKKKLKKRLYIKSYEVYDSYLRQYSNSIDEELINIYFNAIKYQAVDMNEKLKNVFTKIKISDQQVISYINKKLKEYKF